jgi:hypothetical protein
MIESIKIQNFRCFSELEVSALKPINIIVGENASGKSAFLEAIFLSGGAYPLNIFQFRTARQLGSQFELRPDPASYWGLWEDLFYDFDLTRHIRIEVEGPGSSRVVNISRNLESSQTVLIGNQPIPPQAFALLAFDWIRDGKAPIRVSPTIKGNSLTLEVPPHEHFPTLHFGPHISDLPQENASRFSELSKDGRIQPVIEALRAEFPFIKTMSLEINSGTPTVFAEVHGTHRKLPVGLISDGVNKLLSLLLGIANDPGGTILIDQIEDGFYFKKMASTWRVIHNFANANGTQIFATTHSQECLDALLPALEANESDFALLRASRSEGAVRFAVSNGRQFGAALSQEFEIR